MDNIGLEKVLTQDGHEDYVEYFIFPKEEPDNNSRAKDVLLEYNAAIQSLTRDYIWQKDSLLLKQVDNLDDFDESENVLEKDKSKQPLCFHGVTRFGDNIEDEWFVTWVLLELSKKFPGCVIRVIDNDGEFLLIEAADYLPDWAESDAACLQRVYLYDGQVHLIPYSVIPASESKDKTLPNIHTPPQMLTAVQAVRNVDLKTVASKSIQTSVRDRIGKYPEKIFDNFQHVNLMLPAKLAAILSEQPNLVAAGVNAFFYREPIGLTAVKLMKNFKPGDCLVKSRVRLTRCLYAMLSKQDFRPDPKVGWSFPRPTSYDFKSHSLGAKLTVGFEILLSQSISQSLKEDAGSGLKELESSPGWLRYVESLKKNGYFKDLLEGSKPYQELMDKAMVFYRESVLEEKSGSSSGDSSLDEAVQVLRKLFKSIEFDANKMKKTGSSLPPDDDDSWMQLEADNFDSMLAKHFQMPDSSKPEDIPEKLKEFMKTISDLEGVDLPSSSLKKNGMDNEAPSSSSFDGNLDPMDFRADDFVSAMDKLLTELGKPDGDWDASDDENCFSDEEAMDQIMKQHTFKKDSKIHQLMEEMDSELADTNVGKTFTEPGSSAAGGQGQLHDEFDDVEKFEPVNIDINALTNMLKSFQSQEFPAGPSANLLKSVGFDISKVSIDSKSKVKNSSDKSKKRK